MHIIAVDDEKLALETLRDAICEAAPNETPICFHSAREALDYAAGTSVDIAFLDIRMDGMSGLELAEQLLKIHKETNIIFVTGYSDYQGEAFEMYASGYVKKPVRAKRIARELQNLRYPPAVKIGSFTFDNKALKVLRDGEDMLLVPREYALFRLLAENMGEYILPETLYEQAWGQMPCGDIRTLYEHLSRLRKKLGLDETSTLELEQQRGRGYRLIPHERTD